MMQFLLLLIALPWTGAVHTAAIRDRDAKSSPAHSLNVMSSILISSADIRDILLKRTVPTEPQLITSEPSVFTNIYWDATTAPKATASIPHQPHQGSQSAGAKPEPRPFSKGRQSEHEQTRTATSTKIITSALVHKPTPAAESKPEPRPVTVSHHTGHGTSQRATSTRVIVSTLMVSPLPRSEKPSDDAITIIPITPTRRP